MADDENTTPENKSAAHKANTAEQIRLLEAAAPLVKVPSPDPAEVAQRLRSINTDVPDGPCDVRLQVYPDGRWAVRWGLSDYDQDHRGFWGASSVPGKRWTVKASLELARNLIDQAADQAADDGHEFI